MKKIIRISDSFENKYKDDFKEAEKEVPWIRADFAFIWDIFYDIDWKFKFLEKSKKENNLLNLEDYDLFWVWCKKARDISICLKYFLNLKNKKVIDSWSKFKASWKSWNAIYFNEKNIKTPKTLFFTNWKNELWNRINENIKLVESRFSYPFIAKYSNLSRWEWIFLIKNRNDFKILLKDTKEFETILIQDFIENKWDFRVIVTKKWFIWAIKRYNKNDFKNNISSWWESEKVDEIPEIVKKISINIANDLNMDILWIDFFIEWEDYKIIETNTSPQYNWFNKTTWLNLPVELLKYFKEL